MNALATTGAKPAFLIAEPDRFSEEAVSILSETASVTLEAIGQIDMAAALRRYDGIWIRLGLKVGVADIPQSPDALRCRYLVAATTGTDHVDVACCEAQGIQFFCLRGHDEFLETVRVTAEHALGLLLGLARRVPAAFRSVQAGQWERDRFHGIELQGKTAGVVGLGRLGRAMSGYLAALGLNVIAYDPYIDSSIAEALNVRLVASLPDLLDACDIVSLHVKLTEETAGMIGEREFSQMRAGTLLVNTSRGHVIDESALLNALVSGHLGGAGLDVLAGEPAIGEDNPLVRYARERDNLLITPHIGGAVDGVMQRCETYLAGVVRDAMRTA